MDLAGRECMKDAGTTVRIDERPPRDRAMPAAVRANSSRPRIGRPSTELRASQRYRPGPGADRLKPVRFVSGLVALVCCGCLSKPGFSGGDGGTGSEDAPSDGTSDGACTPVWGAPVVQSEFNNKITGEPTITSDLRHLYFAKQLGAMQWEIHSATRSSTATSFSVTSSQLFGAPVSTYDQDPAVTDDNELVVFIAGSPPKVSQARWNGSSWVIELALDLAVATLDVSPDGLTLYYAVSGGDLFETKRMSRGVPFTASATTIASGVLFPAVTGDGLTLYAVDGTSPGTGIAVRTRPSTTDTFGGATAAVHLFSGWVDPDVTADGKTLVLSKSGTMLGVATLACP